MLALRHLYFVLFCSFLAILLFLLFEMGVFTVCHWKLEIRNFFLIYEFFLELKRGLNIGFVINVETVKTIATHGDELSEF
jgi:hypothetical protein